MPEVRIYEHEQYYRSMALEGQEQLTDMWPYVLSRKKYISEYYEGDK